MISSYHLFAIYNNVFNQLQFWILTKASIKFKQKEIKMKFNVLVRLTTILGLFISTNLAVANETITVVATKFPNGDVLKVTEPILKQQGYDLKIIEIPSYTGHGIVTEKGSTPQEIHNPNLQVLNGKYDANFFQPDIYLDEYNKLSGSNLADIGKIFYVPFAIYLSPNHKLESESLSILAKKHDRMTVGIPTSYIDAARALKLLEANHLISLNQGEQIPNISDITANPYHLHIIQVDNEVMPKLALNNSFDMIVMNSGRAYLKHLYIKNNSLVENNPDRYSNVVVTTTKNQNSPKMKALVKALQSAEVHKFIQQNYKGVVKASF